MSLTFEKINEQNRAFWARQSALLEQRFQDPALRSVALRTLASEVERAVPLCCRTTMEQAFADAEGVRKEFSNYPVPGKVVTRSTRAAGSPIRSVGQTRDAIVTKLALDPNLAGVSAKKLWDHFIQVLSSLGLSPTENTETSKWFIEYRDRNRVAIIRFKRFENLVSKARAQRESH